MAVIGLTRTHGRRLFGGAQGALLAWTGGLASALDGLTTYLGIRSRGSTESNPLQAHAIAQFGLAPTIVGRVLIGVALFVLAGRLLRVSVGRRRRSMLLVAGGALVLTAGIALSNVNLLLH